MKSITYAEKSWLVGDEAAAVLVEYAVLLARTGSADSISFNVLSPEGAPGVLTLLIGPASMMTAADSDVGEDEPNNDEAVIAIRERMRAISSPPSALPAADATGEVRWEDLA